ncbi:MAG: hypothetical protein IPK64_19900 [bacterium]|nr:hypothetical protein [bacterium]
MGSPISFLRTFPPAQQKELAAALRLCRRRVDQSLSDVTITTNATSTVATLKCPANELGADSVIHCRVAGSLAANASALGLTPLIAINGTTFYTDQLTVPDAGTDTIKSFLLDFRIYWKTPTTARLEGQFQLSTDNVAAADTGAGALGGTDTIGAAFNHELTSLQQAMDHIITVTMAAANGLSGTSKVAALWVE